MWGTFSEITLGISAIVVAYVAIAGLNTWKREIAGRTLFEASKTLIKASLKIVSDYEWATHPVSSSTESENRPKSSDEKAEVSQVFDQWYLRKQRIKPLIEDYQSALEATWEIRTILGSQRANKIETLMHELKVEIVKLNVDVDAYFEIRVEEERRGSVQEDDAFKKELKRTIFQLPESDQNQNLKRIAADLETELGRYIRGKNRSQ